MVPFLFVFFIYFATFKSEVLVYIGWNVGKCFHPLRHILEGYEEVRDRKSKRDKTLKVIKIPMKIRTDRNSCTFDIPSRKPVQNSQF